MLVLPSLIIIVFAKRVWLRYTAGCIWLLGLINSLAKGTVIIYILATALWLGILYLIRWIIRKARSKRASRAESNELDSTYVKDSSFKQQ